MSNYRDKRWILSTIQPQLQCSLSKELEISPTIAGLLINRGICTAEEARRFFNCKLENLQAPWVLQGMDKAIRRIIEAKEKSEPVTVYGDYDVDGITGTTLLVEALRELKITVDYYIPHRLEEGYGLNLDALKKIAEQGTKLIITVDCGITAIEAVEFARELGMDLIITDHHQPGDVVPAAEAVINPKLGEETDCYNLAGVGVAFKLVQALWECAGICWYKTIERFLDIVTIGTIADIVPLTGENRVIVKNGLDFVSTTKRVGLKSLLEIAGLQEKKITPSMVAYGIAPRLNAAGRVSNASRGVELLLTSSSQRGREIAKWINKENQQRQVIETQILQDVERRIEEEVDLSQEKVIVLASSMWHPGVIGIVASRVVDKYYRPVILIALEGGEGRGSARSISGFNIYEALKHCSNHLLQFGGHQLAAGMTVNDTQIENFKTCINKYAKKYLSPELLTPEITIDSEVFFRDLDERLLEQLNKMSPFGEGNPPPLLAYRGAQVVEYRPVGRDKNHLKMKLAAEGKEIDTIGFNLYSSKEQIAATKEVDIVFSLEENNWQGQKNIQLNLKDIKSHGKTINNTLSFESEVHMDEKQILPESNYLVQGLPSQLWSNMVNLVSKAVKEKKRVVLLGSTPATIGCFFTANHQIFSELSIPHWLLKASCIKEQLLKIEEDYGNNAGVLCADLISLNEILSNSSIIENCDLVIIFGAEVNNYTLDEVPLDRIHLKGKVLIINSLYNNGFNSEDFKSIKLEKAGKVPADILQKNLNDIIVTNRRTVIYCSTKKEVMDVSGFLWQGSKERTIFYHPWMSTQQQDLAVEMFRQGLAKFFVTTSTIALDKLQFSEQIYFHTLPFDSVHYLYLMSGSKIKSPVDVYISKEAIHNTEDMLLALFPTKKVLTHIYSYFKRFGLTDVRGCIKYLRVNGYSKVNETTIKIARAIFQELGISNHTSHKVNIDSSWRYRIIKNQHNGYQKLLRLLKIC